SSYGDWSSDVCSSDLEAKTDAKALDSAMDELTIIAGQRAQLRRARKSIAGFKVREGMPVGARVTLRGARMWEFLDRLVSIALPQIGRASCREGGWDVG